MSAVRLCARWIRRVVGRGAAILSVAACGVALSAADPPPVETPNAEASVDPPPVAESKPEPTPPPAAWTTRWRGSYFLINFSVPFRVLYDAEQDAKAGRHAEALAKHLWYQEHAEEHDPGLVGVRRTSGMSEWAKLARDYPPAMQALRAARDRAAATAREGGANQAAVLKGYHAFLELQSIDWALDEVDRTLDLFRLLDRTRPAVAASTAFLVRDELIAAGDAELAGKYLELMHVDVYVDVHLQFREASEQAAAAGEFEETPQSRRMRELSDGRFRREMAIYVALLSITGREGPAAERAERAKAILDDAASVPIIDAALAGEFPPPRDP